MKSDSLPLVAVTGLGRGESPQPGSAIIRSLRRRWPQLRMAGLAYDALESGIYADDRPEVSFTMPYPSCGGGTLLARIDEIRAEFPFTVFIPTLDAELEPLLGIREALEQRGVKTLLPDKAALQARRKQDLPKLAAEAGVAVPVTMVAYDAEEARRCTGLLGGAAMIKGALYEATPAHSPEAAEYQAAHLLAEWGGPVLVQEIVEGIELDVLAVGDGRGGALGSCPIRKLVVSSMGKGYAGMTIGDAPLTKAVGSLLEVLQWRGPVEFEFMRSHDGTYYLIEINPRFPAWADFPSALGCNLAAAALEQLVGAPVQRLPQLPAGKVFIRHSQDVVCDAEDFHVMAAEGRTAPRPTLFSL